MAKLKYLFEDIFIQMVSFIGPFRIKNNDFDIYRFFSERKLEYPNLLKDINYNNDPMFPYSSQIEEGLGNLALSDFLIYDFTTSTINATGTDADCFMDDELKEIKEIAEKFKNKFKLIQENI